MTAEFSPCRTWRYTLTREIGTLGAEGVVAFVGLNPSTADETQDDPTIRRCLGYARTWGYARLVMLNLFAFRATYPAKLGALDFSVAVGPENNRHLYAQAHAADLVVCAWGTHGAQFQRGVAIEIALRSSGVPLHVLGLTKDGHPKHPLYLRADAEPYVWERETVGA